MTYLAIMTGSQNSTFSIAIEADNFETAARKAGDLYDQAYGNRPVGNQGEQIRVSLTNGDETRDFAVWGFMVPTYIADDLGANHSLVVTDELKQAIMEDRQHEHIFPLKSIFDGC